MPVPLAEQMYRYIMGQGSGFSGVLDNNPGAAAAYSIRKLSSTYAGAPLRVRRVIDGTEQDIEFNSDNELDTDALTTFVDGGAGFVSKWYDQSGGTTYDLTVAASGQPRIATAGGVVMTQNGKPCLTFNGTSHYLTGSNLLTELDNSDFLISTVFADEFAAGSDADVPRLYFRHRAWSYNTLNTMTWDPLTGHSLLSFEVDGATQEAFGNGTSLATASEAQVDFPQTDFLVGRYASAGYMTGTMQELIIYPSLPNRTGIESNMATYYGITI